ncbi:UvrD-helicase domain-containing protein [Achromobacter mucicolens]|jgi:DNA helicase-2/ATP-dependent DNA helicase PcrA|uniref:DNA 3'-5' helicase n=1 Tax=Achromobacter mucicolens TaxID=1389922 RepID=A0ABD4YUB0_9BURK|nr:MULTISPECIES: UvrD-helicase domain-containing protein [Achromobacter]KXJ64655.1 DNA helicase II [Achromobacter xylosoxidans]KRB12294.1 DNA helicase II [Achromobacter sp. Root170]MCP2515725.1 UvrD-helicase domain-containing protein [Achromobacter mucicolens]MCU6618631.1 UvrD-helicase domain-containing protein [Achromobacter mucicolens]MDF2861400.1 helicase [Achromobacter mucicolens]
MMLEKLNPEQRAAVTLEPQHALVLAGAGSGKTRVLTTRMAWLIQTGQASPFGLLAVTFTNKAAREMLARMSAILPIDTRGLWIGTFHGLCNRMLRAHHRDAGLPQSFQILDVTDQLAAIKRLMKANGVDDEKYPPRDVQRFINGAKEEGLRPADVEAYDAHRRRLIEIYQLYEAQCQREGVVDFAELLLRAYELLSRNAPVREHYQRRFRHILVDEFQDTNTLQYKWLRLLAGGGAAIFAVGDDDQSIYAFRGANVGNMADFERDYAHGTVIRLEQNYRSYGHILDSANALIGHNSGRLGKNLWTDQGEGEPVRVIEQPSDGMEAQWIVDEIRSLIHEGSDRREIAVLYRSNAQSRVIEHAIFSAGIPYKVYGGLRFFERQEIKHALAYLRLMANPHDDTSWMRVVNFPTRGIGARTLEQLADAAREHDTSLYGAVARVAGKGGSNLAQFAQLIHRLIEETRELPLPEMVEHMLEASGLNAHYKAEREGAERLENLNELITAAAVFASEENYDGMPAGQVPDGDTSSTLMPGVVDAPAVAGDNLTPLAAFLSHAALEAGDNQAQQGQDAVQLMTVHAAKGLEFDAVFITGLEEGLFPHENSILEPAGLEEERRLMYVAITRARQRLYISLAQSRMLHGQTRYAMRSRFLDEIPEQHLKWLTPKAGLAPVSATGAGWGGGNRGDAFGRKPTNTIAPRQPRGVATGVTVGDKQYRVGQGVRHARFGDGTIIGLSGAGQDAQAEIHFRDVGAKTLALGIAKLDIVQG